MKLSYLLKGIVKSIPGIERLYKFEKTTGGTDKARYCYAVWLRHLVMAWENGYTAVPKHIAELGPGDSLGIGISALISGAEQYHALDIVRYSTAERSLKIFDELVTLFKNRASIPSQSEFPNMKPSLKSYDFPSHILTDEYLNKVLSADRLQKIRNAIESMDNPDTSKNGTMIKYCVPWNNEETIERESVDMIISQAVLQHVDNLELTFRCMNKWLRNNGIMSHTIDFKSMGSSATWDGHWTYSDMEWKIVKGRKKYLINREPYSTYLKLLQNHGFDLIFHKKAISESFVSSGANLAKRFRNMPKEDFTISGAFIQATKRIFIKLSLLLDFVIKKIASASEVDLALNSGFLAA
jgi:hypothetical protein